MVLEEFNKIFGAFGTITSSSLASDESGKGKGFGFVNYESHEAAAACVDAMNEKDLNGKVLYVCRAKSKSEREEELRIQAEKDKQEKSSKYQGINIYVKNLDESIDDEKLRLEFAAFGVITSAKVAKDDKVFLFNL